LDVKKCIFWPFVAIPPFPDYLGLKIQDSRSRKKQLLESKGASVLNLEFREVGFGFKKFFLSLEARILNLARLD